MRKIIPILILIMAMFFSAAFAVAGDKATEQECVAKCKEAADLVKEKGLEAALAVTGDKNGPFV